MNSPVGCGPLGFFHCGTAIMSWKLAIVCYFWEMIFYGKVRWVGLITPVINVPRLIYSDHRTPTTATLNYNWPHTELQHPPFPSSLLRPHLTLENLDRVSVDWWNWNVNKPLCIFVSRTSLSSPWQPSLRRSTPSSKLCPSETSTTQTSLLTDPPPLRLLSYLTISLCDDDDDYHDEEWRCASLSACRVTP